MVASSRDGRLCVLRMESPSDPVSPAVPMRRVLLVSSSIILTVIATVDWPFRYAFIAVVIAATLAQTIANVVWPKRRAPWFRGEREAG